MSNQQQQKTRKLASKTLQKTVIHPYVPRTNLRKRVDNERAEIVKVHARVARQIPVREGGARSGEPE